MGTTQVKGGTTKVGEIDPAVIPSSGPDASGKFCNSIPGGKILGDLDISIKKGSAGTISLGGGTAVPFGTTGTAHVPITMTGGQCQDYTIGGLAGDGSGDNVIINVTPSEVKTIAGNLIESNILPIYRFDSISDLARNGAEMHHAAALALVHNEDGSQRLTTITGTVSFPGASSAVLTDVHLFEADNDPLSPTVTITGNDFTLSNFGDVATGSYVQVLLVLDTELGSDPARAELRGTFAP